MSPSFVLGRATLMALALSSAAMAQFETVTTSSTTAAPTATPTPVFNPGVGTYSLVGCYAEPDGARALPSIFLSANQTVETCIAQASAAGATYCGLEYGDECWYGTTVHRGAQPKPESECNFPCPGNAAEYCGAGNRLLLYSVGGVIPPVDTTAPTQPATVSGAWSFKGCMTEAIDVRALSAASYASDAMTLESCANFCASYTYFGVEYSRECYCGNSFNNGSVPVAGTDCSMVCSGNGREFCGAGNRLSSYVKI